MDSLYPAAPANCPDDLTEPTPRYRRHVWFAVLALLLLIGTYGGLTAWFGWHAGQLLASAVRGEGDVFRHVALGLPLAFLALFMLKGLWPSRPEQDRSLREITRDEQPRLFDFIERLADEARAPRPHKVFVSSRVNAAVFYDLSPLNLVLPSRKNLEIGLGLVNVLDLGEFKAVLAHEFGHFAQRSMAVGRWVYVAQQVATKVIGRRDALDRFLQAISGIDLRLAWIGWTMRLIVWSLRSLLEALLRGVVLAQRALGREMEYQADLVAVALSGSDALIHALHKAQGADDAWDRALRFAGRQHADQRLPEDVFAIQTAIATHMARITGDAQYLDPPPLPAMGREGHRVFKTGLARPPAMWMTHPPSADREENAKRRYLASASASQPVWTLFEDAPGLRAEMTRRLVGEDGAAVLPTAEALAILDRELGDAIYDGRYAGVYLGRDIARHLQDPHVPGSAVTASIATLDALYPPDMRRLIGEQRELADAIAQLEALHDGRAEAPGGIIRHRGNTLRRRELPAAIAALRDEQAALDDRIQKHDERCRGVHLAIAERLGHGWPEYLRGLFAVIHYAEHLRADLDDAEAHVQNVLAIITVDGKVSDAELKRLLRATDEVQSVLDGLYSHAGAIRLSPPLAEAFGASSLDEALGTFNLGRASQGNINAWLGNVGGWIGAARGALGHLRHVALEQLLASESRLADAFRSGEALPEAPAAPQAPRDFNRRMPGHSRPRQTRLGWWDRFQTADGIGGTVLRSAVALAITGLAVAAPLIGSEAEVHVFNGLGQPVVVDIGGTSRTLDPGTHASLDITPGTHAVRTTTGDGRVVEAFDWEVPANAAPQLYNVARASGFVRWTATYGNRDAIAPQPLGNARLQPVTADYVFDAPPEQISSNTDGGTRTVIESSDPGGIAAMLAGATGEGDIDAMASAHVLWDPVDDPRYVQWAWLGRELPATREAFQARLQREPRAVELRRLEQDLASDTDKPAVCAAATADAAAEPDSADFAYLAIRCGADSPEQDAAFLAARQRWPEHAWLNLAGGYVVFRQGDHAAAQSMLLDAIRARPALGAQVGHLTIRLGRLLNDDANWVDASVVSTSPDLAGLLAFGDQPSLQAVQAGEGKSALQAAEAEGTGSLVLRLLATDPAADRGIVEQALRLPLDEDFGPGVLAATLGLRLREQQPVEDVLGVLAEQLDPSDHAAARALAEALQRRDITAADQALRRATSPDLYGQFAGAGVVCLGDAAPTHWRQAARTMLFAHERPRGV